MRRNPYNEREVPKIPLQMFRFVFGKAIDYSYTQLKNSIDFIVGRRSETILKNTEDYTHKMMKKPIHPMGIGMEGQLIISQNRWSFPIGEWHLLARFSLSQGGN